MPHGVAEIRTKVYTRQNYIYFFPQVGSQGNAVGGGAVYAMCFDTFERYRRTFVVQRSRRGYSMSHRRLLHVRSNNPYFTEPAGYPCQRRNTRTIYSVVICNENSHDSSVLFKSLYIMIPEAVIASGICFECWKE